MTPSHHQRIEHLWRRNSSLDLTKSKEMNSVSKSKRKARNDRIDLESQTNFKQREINLDPEREGL